MTDTMEETETDETPQGYILRDLPDLTVAQLHNLFGAPSKSLVTEPAKIISSIKDDQTIVVYEAGQPDGTPAIEIPATTDSILHLANYFDIPGPFIKKWDPEVQDLIFNAIIARSGGEAVLIKHNDEGMTAMRNPNLPVVDPRKVLDVAAEVVGEDAEVVDAWVSPKGYQFEVIVREGSEFEIGDAQVGDLSRGGLRFGQDTQHNLAPWVQQYVYRLICTNGMEIPSNAYKFDGRGNSAEQMITHLEEMARKAFEEVESQMVAFYDLRSQKVTNGIQLLRRMAQEQGLPDRVISSMEDRLPSLIEDPTDTTMFDIVNIITNQANHEDFFGRANVRRNLHRAGGAVTTDHAARCRTCSSRIGGRA